MYNRSNFIGLETDRFIAEAENASTGFEFASESQATARAAAHRSSAPSEHDVVIADARDVAQHAPPFRAQLPTVTWPDSASGEANPASPCAAPAPVPQPLLRQLRRSTETTDTPEAASDARRARAGPAGAWGVCASGPSWALFSCLWRGRMPLLRNFGHEPH